MRHSVFGRVYHPPFHGVAEVGKRGEYDGEVAAPLLSGGAQEAVDVLEEDVVWAVFAFLVENAVNLSPEDALFTLNSTRLAEG